MDTGFTGDLTLPAESVSSLALTEQEFVEAQLADGSTTALRTHEARVLCTVASAASWCVKRPALRS